MPRGSGRLLVGGQEGVLERLDQRVALDSLLTLDRAQALDDLSAHLSPFVDQVAPHDRLVRDVHAPPGGHGDRVLAGLDDLAAEAPPAADLGIRAQRDLPADRVAEVSRLRRGRSTPGDETSIV